MDRRLKVSEDDGRVDVVQESKKPRRIYRDRAPFNRSPASLEGASTYNLHREKLNLYSEVRYSISDTKNRA